MKILFAGDLSFDWMPKPPLTAMLGNLLRTADSKNDSAARELDISPTKRARILTQADRLFKGIRHVCNSADHFCVNLECSLSDRGQPLEKKRYTMRALPHYALALRKMGVSLACLANNHVLDYGPDSLADTLRMLDSFGIQYCGLRQKRTDAPTPTILTAGAERIGVFNLVEPNIIDPDPDLYFSHEPCPYPLDSSLIIDAVSAQSRTMPVVVVLHWGEEWSYLETAQQRELAHALIDAGASAVIGHHTHLAGVVEEYKGRPIAYSLGNLFLQLPPFSTRRAAPRLMIQLEFSGGAYGGFEVSTVEPNVGGFPSSPASYRAESLKAGYLPASIPNPGPVIFDSLKALRNAHVTMEPDSRSAAAKWDDLFCCDRSIIEGKLALGPGWRSDSAPWTGVALHREFIAPEFLSTNLAHTSGDVTVNCRFSLDARLNRLFVITGVPEGLRNRPGFACPSLSIHSGENMLFELDRAQLSGGWLVQELPVNKFGSAPAEILVSVRGIRDSYGYLNWRLIGL